MKTFKLQISSFHVLFIIILVSLFLCSCASKLNKNVVKDKSHNFSESSYFSAQGSSPLDWSVEISENMISLRSDDGSLELNSPHVEPVKAMDANVKYYYAKTESGSIKIDIVQKDCQKSEGDDRVTYVVKITSVDGKGSETVFEGCGEYRVDYRLHDVWILEQMQGREVTTDMFLGELPMLEIRAKEKDFSGFGGCNKILGKLFQERELLRFVDISNSKMMCDPKNKEDFFLRLLQSGTAYEIKNNRLYVSNQNGVLLVFKKID